MCPPQVCPNETRTQSLLLGDCPTAQFSHQPGGFQKCIVHVPEQHRTKPTPAHRLSPGLPGCLHTTSAPGYQRGMTLPASGPPPCKHGPKKKPTSIFFLLQSRVLRHLHKGIEGAGKENEATKFRVEYKLQTQNMTLTLSGAKPLQYFQTMRQQTTLALSADLDKFWKGTSPKQYDVIFPYICLALTDLPLHCQHLWLFGPEEKH